VSIYEICILQCYVTDARSTIFLASITFFSHVIIFYGGIHNVLRPLFFAVFRSNVC